MKQLIKIESQIKKAGLKIVEFVSPEDDMDASFIVEHRGKTFDIQVCQDGTLALMHGDSFYEDELTFLEVSSIIKQ